MKKHNHIFNTTGGGTDLVTDKINRSDMSYECECGETIRVYMSSDVYFSRKFPKKIACEKD